MGLFPLILAAAVSACDSRATSVEPWTEILALSVDHASMGERESLVLHAYARVHPRSAPVLLDPAHQVSWRSSSPEVATAREGVVSAHRAGQARITATSLNGASAWTDLVVHPVPTDDGVQPPEVATISVAPSSLVLTSGDTAGVTALLTDQAGDPVHGEQVTWSSSDPSVARVEETGNQATVIALSEGTATFTATSSGRTGTASVRVEAPPEPDDGPPQVGSVTVGPSSVDLIAGIAATLTASVRDVHGNLMAGEAVTWSSSNPSVATVQADGGQATISGVSMGTATVTAVAGERAGSASVRVEAPPESDDGPPQVGSVTVGPSSVNLTAGNAATLTASVRDVHGNLMTGQTVTWSSSNPSVATVAGGGTQGLATALAPGSATITASSGGFEAAVRVEVTSGLLFFDDFETGGFSRWSNIETCCDHSANLVPNPRGSGTVLRMELRYADPRVANGPRSELTTLRNPAPNDFPNLFGGPGDEFWWGFRVLVPEEWVDEAADVVVHQIHGQPMLEEGEQWRSPPFSVNIQGGRWKVWSRWDNSPITVGTYGKQNVWDAGPVQKGKWVDWIIHARWSHHPPGHPNDDGVLEVWQVADDATLKVVDYRGPTYYNDKRQGYLKLGIYKWPWNHGPTNVDRLFLFYDQMRVAGRQGDFGLVAPR